MSRLPILLLMAMLCAQGALAAGIGVVLSTNDAPYQEMAEAVERAAQATGLDVARRAPEDPATNDTLIITVGSAALEQVLAGQGKTPVLSLLVPATAYARIVAAAPITSRARASAIYLDQPEGRLLALVAEAFPEKTRVGTLLADESRSLEPRLRSAARRFGLTLISRDLGSDVEPLSVLPELLRQTDVFLVLPDAKVSNRYVAPTLLLQTYRQRLPVVGFSQGWLTAGAALALFSTPEQMAASAMTMIRDIRQNGAVPPPRYATQFTVGVNRYVTRSLGLSLKDEAVLAEWIRTKEAGP